MSDEMIMEIRARFLEGPSYVNADTYRADVGYFLGLMDNNINPSDPIHREVVCGACEGSGHYPCHKCEREVYAGTVIRKRFCLNCDPCPNSHCKDGKVTETLCVVERSICRRCNGIGKTGNFPHDVICSNCDGERKEKVEQLTPLTHESISALPGNEVDAVWRVV